MVFVRDGYEYSVRVKPGFLGVSVMDTVIRGAFIRPVPRQERVPEDDKDKKTKPMTGPDFRFTQILVPDLVSRPVTHRSLE